MCGGETSILVKKSHLVYEVIVSIRDSCQCLSVFIHFRILNLFSEKLNRTEQKRNFINRLKHVQLIVIQHIYKA